MSQGLVRGAAAALADDPRAVGIVDVQRAPVGAGKAVDLGQWRDGPRHAVDPVDEDDLLRRAAVLAEQLFEPCVVVLREAI